MKRPPISDAQMDLLATRLAAAGVGRRDFLRVAAGLAAMGAAGFNARPAAAAAPKLAPGEKLARDQHFRYGGGGWFQNDPSSHDFNKDLYCNGVPALWAGLMKFDVNFQPVPYVAEKISSNPEGSVWTFTIRKDSRWSDGSPCTAKDFEWSWKRQMDPASKNPYSSYFYDIKGAEAFNKSKVPDASQVGVQAKGDWTLEVTLEGPRGYFPVLSAYLAALPAHRGAVEKHGDKWTEAANIVCNGPFTLEAWEHNKVMVLRKNKHFIGAKDVTLDKVTIPIISVQSGALPYEGNELDMTSLQTGDLKRLRVDPRTAKQVFRYPFPGTWYLTPQVTKPPFDNVKVRRAVAHAIDRDNVVRVADGFAVAAHAMIPPGFPGAVDDKKIRDIQRFDPKAAMEQLKGTPFEGGRNWPKITLTMREEGYGSKPLAEAVQSVLLEHLNMKTELEVLEQRVFRAGLWKNDYQFVWIRWFMDYPDPHNEYFDTFYGKKTEGKRQAWGNDAFDRELEAGRDTRDAKKRLANYARAEEIMQTDGGYVPVACDARAGGVRLELARARDGHLHEQGRDRREDRQQDHRDRVRPPLVVVPASSAEHRGPLGHVREVGDRAGERCGDGRDQHVAVLHVRELVGQHALELFLVQDPHDSLGHRHDGVLWVTAGGKGVRRLARDQVDPRHRDAGACGQAMDDCVESRCGGLVDGFGTVRGQHDLVREPVAHEVHGQGEEEGDHHSLLAPEGATKEHEDNRQARQKQPGLEYVRHGRSLAEGTRPVKSSQMP